MVWIDEDNHKTPCRRAVGRPQESPFPSHEREEDFVRCAKAMIDLYFRPEQQSRKEFVFDPDHAVSKTLFWTMIYLYLAHFKGMADNKQGFYDLIITRCGKEVICDRTGLTRSVLEHEKLRSYLKHDEEIHPDELKRSPADLKAQKKARNIYLNIIKAWAEVEK